MSIVNIGSLNLDYVYRVDQFLLPGETKSSLSLDVNAGGKGLNQSIAMAKAGNHVYHAGVYGAGGDMLVQTLEKYGVDMILLQNEINSIGLIIDLAYEKKIPIAMNIAPMGPEVAGYDLSKLTWIVVNEIEGAALAGGGSVEETMENLCSKYPNSGILMTLGSDGVWLRKGQENIRMNALKIENVVDTTAAGDTFLGYFLAGITSGVSTVEALQQATCASAMAIQKPGAAQSVPDREELLHYWQEKKHLLTVH